MIIVYILSTNVHSFCSKTYANGAKTADNVDSTNSEFNQSKNCHSSLSATIWFPGSAWEPGVVEMARIHWKGSMDRQMVNSLPVRLDPDSYLFRSPPRMGYPHRRVRVMPGVIALRTPIPFRSERQRVALPITRPPQPRKVVAADREIHGPRVAKAMEIPVKDWSTLASIRATFLLMPRGELPSVCR
jgi:hypothetical protein